RCRACGSAPSALRVAPSWGSRGITRPAEPAAARRHPREVMQAVRAERHTRRPDGHRVPDPPPQRDRGGHALHAGDPPVLPPPVAAKRNRRLEHVLALSTHQPPRPGLLHVARQAVHLSARFSLMVRSAHRRHPTCPTCQPPSQWPQRYTLSRARRAPSRTIRHIAFSAAGLSGCRIFPTHMRPFVRVTPPPAPARRPPRRPGPGRSRTRPTTHAATHRPRRRRASRPTGPAPPHPPPRAQPPAAP